MPLDTRRNHDWKKPSVNARLVAVIFLLLAAFFLTSEDATAADPVLTVTLAGAGTGTVNSITPAGFACGSSSCNTTFPLGTPVTLRASPDWKSLVSWDATCSVTGNDCQITLNADTVVTATFNIKNQVMVQSMFPREYGTLQEAYNSLNGAETNIAAHTDYIFYEPFLAFNRAITVNLLGGMDGPTYATPSGGYTILQGSLTIALGSATISNLIIK